MHLKPISLSHDMTLLHLPHDRYRTDRLTGLFAVPLRKETAAGMALLPGLLTHACRQYPTTAAFNRKLESLYGATIRSAVHRIGGWQVVLFSVTFLNSRYTLDGADLSAECTRLLLDTLFEPVLEQDAFLPEMFAQEQRCLLEELSGELNDKRHYARRRCMELLCPDHPFSLDPNGTVETVQAETPATTAAAHKRLLQEARIHWLYQSASDPTAVMQAIEQRFDTLPMRQAVSYTPDLTFVMKESRQTEEMDINQAKLVLGFRMAIAEPDDRVPAAQLMNALWGGNPHSLLFTHVREEQSLCYYCLSSYDRYQGVLLVDSGVQPETAVRTEEEILKQLEAIRQGNFSDEELEAARRSLTQRYAACADTPAHLEAHYVPQLLSDTLFTPEEMGRRLLAVTREDVCRAARSVHFDSVYLLQPNGEVCAQ